MATEPHHGLMRKYSEARKPIASPPYQRWPRSQSVGMHAHLGVSSEGYHWKPLWWGRGSAVPTCLAIDQGAVCLAPRLALLVSSGVPAVSAFPGLLFILVASFPDKGNFQEAQPVVKESYFTRRVAFCKDVFLKIAFLSFPYFIYRISGKNLYTGESF